MIKRRDPIVGSIGGRRQRGYARLPQRSELPGLHWQTDSVIRAGRPVSEALNDLRSLWIDHANPAALKDALWLCSEGATSEPIAVPAWLSESLSKEIGRPAFADQQRDHDDDLCALGWLDHCQLAHAHGLSKLEAVLLVVDIQRALPPDPRRQLVPTIDIVKRAIAAVPRRAKANRGRFYAGVSDGNWWYRLPGGSTWEGLWLEHTKTLRRRRPGAVMFGIPQHRVRRK